MINVWHSHLTLAQDPHDVRVKCFVNDVQKQDGHTNDMIFKVPTLLHYISRCGQTTSPCLPTETTAAM